MNMEMPPNKIEKEKVLEMLRKNGFEHPETRELLDKWTKQRKIEIDASKNPCRDEIILNMEISDLYLAAGKIVEAFTNFEDALDQADQEGDIELQNQIVAKLKILRSQYPKLVRKTATFPLLPENTE